MMLVEFLTVLAEPITAGASTPLTQRNVFAGTATVVVVMDPIRESLHGLVRGIEVRYSRPWPSSHGWRYLIQPRGHLSRRVSS